MEFEITGVIFNRKQAEIPASSGCAKVVPPNGVRARRALSEWLSLGATFWRMVAAAPSGRVKSSS